MASLSAWLAVFLLIAGVEACSPEARRTRDSGPGADPGNKIVVNAPPADPQAADTTLWPGRAAAPTDRLADGTMPPPAAPATKEAPAKRAPSKSEQRAFTKSGTDPRTPPEPRNR
ncbi:MAG TPA: hypothetical protein VF252_01265 [Gemmatimonadales bacterium]